MRESEFASCMKLVQPLAQRIVRNCTRSKGFQQLRELTQAAKAKYQELPMLLGSRNVGTELPVGITVNLLKNFLVDNSPVADVVGESDFVVRVCR